MSQELPEPDADARAFSRGLEELIRDEMDGQGGRLPFSRFMELALYAPTFGYYSGGMQKFGAAGDFITAPELSPLFSHCVARQCREVLSQLEEGCVLEIGAGSGSMAVDLLLELERLEGVPVPYYILEVSADLAHRQRELIRERIPHLEGMVTWLDRFPKAGFTGVVVANEVLDAMPVHRVRLDSSGLYEWYVGWQEGGFVWKTGEPANSLVAKALDALRGELGEVVDGGYDTELGLAQNAWVRSVGEFLDAGALLIIDYGFPRREFYHPQRSGGTLMCHYRHRAHPNPLILCGLQDITAHVDFSAIADAGRAVGLELAGFTSQAHFLLANGLIDGLDEEQAQPTPEYLKLASQVKRLTMPGEMGELFKVLALTRGVDRPLNGFQLQDRSWSL
ncbi:MAG: SAM-dependent methyltransferase [Gammaproteobacteria bacterium]|nr:SAM-dependent methyltransferase [Gammaproteobacteria bacterium]